MNNEQASKASKCDPAKINKALEELDVECPRCKGNSYRDFPRVSISPTQNYNCSHCCDTGKISYSWQPQVGEFVCFPSPCQWIPLITDVKTNHIQVVDGGKTVWLEFRKNKLIPILEWQEIEKVLEKAGYNLIGLDRGESKQFHCDIMKNNSLVVATIAESRQEAVMLAVIELGKEMK